MSFTHQNQCVAWRTLSYQEMEIAMGAVPDTDKKERSTPKKGGGFGGFFRRTKVEETSVEKLAPEKRIQYKPDSFLARTKKK
jgi:hypothetical protein